ncbi:hypothetical protein CGSMWGv55152_01199 [Gardnerella vaginalis 55152]|uniref:Uncharacterized protein n=1 Tax=Gardnerella vaginalis 55152 TaxID=698955 RepID=I4LVQ4_GARVA|nr:hypothetical protein CGSMWGv284V_00240 [Gardnerella vaginalis 284V]EIK81044.1 hypothetical protein CGSMWGv55152_01199 [Gardnerella vaginalis 55152]
MKVAIVVGSMAPPGIHKLDIILYGIKNKTTGITPKYEYQ